MGRASQPPMPSQFPSHDGPDPERSGPKRGGCKGSKTAADWEALKAADRDGALPNG